MYLHNLRSFCCCCSDQIFLFKRSIYPWRSKPSRFCVLPLKVSRLIKLTFRNTFYSKFCLHSLVKLEITLPSYVQEFVMSCFSQNYPLSSWQLFLCHLDNFLIVGSAENLYGPCPLLICHLAAKTIFNDDRKKKKYCLKQFETHLNILLNTCNPLGLNAYNCMLPYNLPYWLPAKSMA